jgi:Tol biopolymer transport system component
VHALSIIAVACGGGHAAKVADAPVVHDTTDAPPAARCDLSQPFGSAVNLGSAVNTALNEATPRLTLDELTLVFSRLNADGTWDMYQATRAAIDQPFGTPSVLGTINSVYSDLWPTLTPDGNTVYFNTNRATPSNSAEQVFVATRASAGDDFAPPAVVTAFMNNDNQPFVNATGDKIYFSSGSRPDTTGGADLYDAPIDGSGNVGAAQILIGAVNTSANEQVPSVTADELTLYFCRSNGTDNDIYMATRSDASAPWGAGSAVPGYATQGVEEVPTWISPDGCDLYFYDNGSDMPDAQGTDDLYEIVRPPSSSSGS